MTMDLTTGLGLIAGVLTTAAFFPQLLKTWTTRSAEDVSLGMLCTLCTGVFLWIVYGIAIQDIPLILANVVTFIFASAILSLKVRYTA